MWNNTILFFIALLSSVYFIRVEGQLPNLPSSPASQGNTLPVPTAPSCNDLLPIPVTIFCVLNLSLAILSIVYIFVNTVCYITDTLIVSLNLIVNLFKCCPLDIILGPVYQNLNQIIIGLSKVKELCGPALSAAQNGMKQLS